MMKLKKVLYTGILVLVVVSCSKGDNSSVLNDPIPENNAPAILPQTFTVPEDINETFIIGSVNAFDAEGDEITFTISGNYNDLFEITKNGELSLTVDKKLDFETSESHTIEVSVYDGTSSSKATMTIAVINVVDTLAEDSNAFVTKWTILSDDFKLIVGRNNKYNYDFTIDWGDGTVENLSELIDSPSHVYETAGTYYVAILGDFPAIQMSNNEVTVGSTNKLKSIEQWGTIKWKSFERAFSGCIAMNEYNAEDRPDLSDVENLSYMFQTVFPFNGDIGDWDTSSITSMEGMFSGARSFNQDIGNWNTSKVTNMDNMFFDAASFNQDVSGWDTSEVRTMNSMFRFIHYEEYSFNQDIGSWNVAKVVDFSYMFSGAYSFDQDLGAWDIRRAEKMSDIFNDSGISAQNYSNTLIGWAAQNPQNHIFLGASGLQFLCIASDAHDDLTNAGWVITDNGLAELCF